MCPVCRYHNPVFTSFMTYHCVCNHSNTTCATSGAGTGNYSGAYELFPALVRFVLLDL
jgi:hypothetical protein